MYKIYGHVLITENVKTYCRNMGEVVYSFIKLLRRLKLADILISKNEVL